jgi:hypothetical protein
LLGNSDIKGEYFPLRTLIITLSPQRERVRSLREKMPNSGDIP